MVIMNKENNTDDIFLQNNNLNEGVFTNNRIYACEDDMLTINCFICVGKDKCTNYRLKGVCFNEDN